MDSGLRQYDSVAGMEKWLQVLQRSTKGGGRDGGGMV